MSTLYRWFVSSWIHSDLQDITLAHGVFPCAPVWPSLAVSLDMLEFVAELFVHVAPNERAWAATLEKYLNVRGYQFAAKDSLRRQFMNALSHYQMLIRLIDIEISKIVDLNWTSTECLPSHCTLDEVTPVNECVYQNAHNYIAPLVPRHEPSLYLQSHCPLCFGGNHTEQLGLLVSCIVCIDANFQLKCNRDLDRRMGHKGETGTWDPLVMSPWSTWLSDEHLAEWEAKINSMRLAKASRTATLNQCLESFTAADGNRVKASTQKFDSTGVMALLCQHDWTIFLANMVTTGEKQFYAYALIAVLLRELPECWKVGLLYDVACALQRSLAKWQFMPGWLDQISFGVSIFHVYGHQWVCQLWYHPRKAELWGLSDGEGCERFWSELMRLIPCLQVSGHGNSWLVASSLDDLNVELLALAKEGLEVTVSSELKTNIDETKEALHKVQNNVAQKVAVLQAMDVTSFTSLEEMRRSPWINAQLNLHVLRTQLVAKLCAQKFELSSLDHAHANRKLDHNTHAHVDAAVKSHTPAIQSNLKHYNEKIRQLLSMRGKNGIPNDAYIPPEIEPDGLLKMDVNQPVWQDANIADFPNGNVPDWLADESVHTNIRMAQEIINCKQDLLRCRAEYSNLRAWFNAEFKATKKAFDVSADLDIKYFLLIKLHYLDDIGLQWKADTVALPGADGGPEWDVMPQLPLLQKARSRTKTEDLVESVIIDGMSDNASSDDDDGGELEEALSEVDAVVLNALDHVDSWFHAA
ncbi:hypothetical protein BS47DRAFT_1364244 [Hydnum rufescens UP504]|uniref:CxC1-like cysteine cluster associated with KDZ transposases domain-containing protein n=1 Tax=Hydnum rufescens UP504 TaxID=1448309 RepID=A0A9P6AS18_9AGAM|nr:hypothetical protein BS47DRAFT_1364244 [Hydnum rufescens UP504]